MPEAVTLEIILRWSVQCIAVVYAALVGMTGWMYMKKWRQAVKGSTSGAHGRDNFGRRKVDIVHWLGLLPKHVAFEGVLGILIATQQFLIATKRIGKPVIWYGTPFGVVLLTFGSIGLVAIIRHEYRLIYTGRERTSEEKDRQ